MMVGRANTQWWIAPQLPTRRWTKAEINRLRRLAEANMHRLEIARELERTSNAVEIQARKHGIKIRRMNRSDHFKSEKS